MGDGNGGGGASGRAARGLGGHLEGLGLGEVDGTAQRVRLGRQLEQVDKQPEPTHQRFVNLDPGGTRTVSSSILLSGLGSTSAEKNGRKPAKSREAAERDSCG